MRSLPLIALALLAASASLAQERPGPTLHGVSEERPRGYGYFVGDRFQQGVSVHLGAGDTLDASALPEVGLASPWLRLESVRQASRETERGIRHQVTLGYQVIGFDVEDAFLEVPGFELVARRGTRSLPVFVAPQPIRVSTLSEPLPADGLWDLDLAPNAGPAPMTGMTRDRRASVGCLLGAIALLGWLGLRRFFRWRAGAGAMPFRAACRDLRRMVRGEGDAREAAQILHGAFNATAGGTLFEEDLEGFFQRRPEFRPVEETVRAFYAASRDRFFGAADVGDVAGDQRFLARALDAARDCARIEAAAA